MTRYCSISTYKKLVSSLNNLKDKCLKDAKLRQDIRDSQFFADGQGISKGFVEKVIIQISRINLELQNSAKVSSAVPNKLQENRSNNNNKYIKTKSLKKVLSSLQKHLSQNKHVLWTAAGVSAVNVDSTVLSEVKPNIEATTVDSLQKTPTDIIPEAPVELISEAPIEPIPEPPPIPQEIIDATVNQLNALGEPTLEALGLGGFSPVGLAQKGFEFLHVSLGLEWWAAIALGTLLIRLCLFPLVILSQRNAAIMNNCLPQMQAIQLKMTEARQTGNQLDTARYAQELMIFMKEKNMNPLKNMIVPLAQMPVFVSVFMGLRGMANVPVESLRTGGMLWFTDLTLADQYYLLPIITSATLALTIELGTDSAKLTSQNGVIAKYLLRALPVVILPFTFSFPGVILCYWVSSNFISLLQVGFLRIPKVRHFFKIEPMAKFDPTALPIKPKGFKEGLKESWTNMKITKELEDRRRLDQIRFQKSGKGPIVKTYKYDPTKQTDPLSSAQIRAKKTGNKFFPKLILRLWVEDVIGLMIHGHRIMGLKVHRIWIH